MKHFNAVSTTEFSDGQAFYDILKVSDQVSGAIIMLRYCLTFKSVHFTLCCRPSPEEFVAFTLYPCLYPLQDSCRPPLYDR